MTQVRPRTSPDGLWSSACKPGRSLGLPTGDAFRPAQVPRGKKHILHTGSEGLEHRRELSVESVDPDLLRRSLLGLGSEKPPLPLP